MLKKLDHPILIHKLNRIRDIRTPQGDLVRLLGEISSFMVYEVLSDLKLERRDIDTWIGRGGFEFVNEKEIVFVPILRAGLPMLDGAMRVVSDVSVGFLAIKRDEETLESYLFYSRLPELENRTVVVLDPMLATGGTLIRALEEVWDKKPKKVVSVHIVCAPEGIERVRKKFPQHLIYTVSVDERLNDKGYIIPGVGDMGDRLYS